MQIFQVQGLFAPFVATLVGTALLLLWRYNRGVRYLPYFSFSLFSFAGAVILSQIVFDKMTFQNAISSSTLYFASSGFMIHAAMSRLGGRLNITRHILLMCTDLSGRIVILQWGLSGDTYLIYVNAMMGLPLAIGAMQLLKHENNDIQSISLAVAFSTIAIMAICITPIAVSLGDHVTSENYFSSYYWFLLSILTVFGICMLVLSFGFTVGSDLLRKVEENASTDFLSGLLTRRAFDKEANQLLDTHGDKHDFVGLIICDIDHFKQINDLHGHQTGDDVIKALGHMIFECLPSGSSAGRIGGEEFAVILPRCDMGAIRLFAEGLRGAFSNQNFQNIPEDKRVTASFGVAILQPQEQLSSVFKRADEALYQAKNSGRNRVVASNPSEPINSTFAEVCAA